MLHTITPLKSVKGIRFGFDFCLVWTKVLVWVVLLQMDILYCIHTSFAYILWYHIIVNNLFDMFILYVNTIYTSELEIKDSLLFKICFIPQTYTSVMTSRIDYIWSNMYMTNVTTYFLLLTATLHYCSAKDLLMEYLFHI